MKNTFLAAFVAATAVAVLAGPADAGLTVQASLFTPQVVPGTTVPIILSGIIPPAQSNMVGTGYTITFSGVDANQGVVQGTLPGIHAVPVAGVTGGNPEYLSGDFGSPLTTNIAASGNYLSTGDGPATITIGFDTPVSAFALLWGSVDDTNNVDIHVSSGNVDLGDITGAAIQAAAAGFVSNGFQGPGGSAYVIINSTTTFDTVALSSGVVSFEAAGLIGSTSHISVPEPASLALLGSGLLGLGLIRRRAA